MQLICNIISQSHSLWWVYLGVLKYCDWQSKFKFKTMLLLSSIKNVLLFHDRVELLHVIHWGFDPDQLLEENQWEGQVDNVVVVKSHATQNSEQEVTLLLHFGLFGSWIKNKTNSMYDLVTFTRRQIVQIPAELALANTWSFTEMKCSYFGREPHQSLALVVHEHLRLGSDELIKQVEEEVPRVDVHHLSLIHKLHLGRRACLNDPQNTNPISSDDKYPSMTYMTHGTWRDFK